MGKSSRQRGNNVNVISNTANVHEFGSEVAADCGQKAYTRVGRTCDSSQDSRFLVLKMM